MKPKNKFQASIVAMSQKLPRITDNATKWGEKNLFTHIARVTKKGKCSCLECGEQWEDKNLVPPTALYDTLTSDRTSCPYCCTTLSVVLTRLKKFSQTEYMCVPTTMNGYQVLRFIYIRADYKVGESAYYYHSEVVQTWIAPNGRYETLARLLPYSYYANSWMFGSDLELRKQKAVYNITPTAIYSNGKITAQIRRNGFNGKYHNLTPFDMFHSLIKSNKAETLLKTNQVELFKHFAYRGVQNIDKYWSSIRIAIRNNYKIQNASMWCDYIDLLERCGKDINSPKYVCPMNLQEQHDKMVKRREQQRERERLEEKRQQAIKDEERFRELKSKFFGIVFADGVLQVRVLESAEEHAEEGVKMHHCVFANDYHLKEKSLILSATIDGERIATIEISLDTLKVVQCRGIQNKEVEEQEQIINLINNNINQIQQRLVA